MPTVTLINPRGTTQAVTELGALEHYLRRGFQPQTGTVADARSAFTGQPATPAALGSGIVTHGAADPATTLQAGTEYVWMKTDGAGTLIDIVSGVA